ncbi:helix-turn-helix domain-containing protein [Chloroflexota bacterium]
MQWLTTVEAGRVLGITARRVRELASKGRISAVRIGGRWLIAESDCCFERLKPWALRSEGKSERGGKDDTKSGC